MTETLLAAEPTLRLGAFLGIFVLMAVWELLAPRRDESISRWQRWPNNIGVVVVNTMDGYLCAKPRMGFDKSFKYKWLVGCLNLCCAAGSCDLLAACNISSNTISVAAAPNASHGFSTGRNIGRSFSPG